MAFTFTLIWVFDALGKALDMPMLQNAEGDEFMFHDVRFPLAAGATQEDIAARLNGIAGMSQEMHSSGTGWNTCRQARTNPRRRVRFPWTPRWTAVGACWAMSS
ncbi:hypothetical protein [Mesorhizobium sp.]|uniref:hypothetical protein n=1 Tax=Mesorhizobium sp. TaxID=1871066 RepID=UPI00257D7DDD|nr:hypothetical protein [Mesorhizobium sp.]